MCMLTSTVSLAFFEGILDYLEQRESGRQEILAQQEINNLRFLNRPLSRWVKVTPFSGMWDRDLMFLQARQILKDFTDTSISSNRHGLFIKLSGPQEARLVLERFHGRKFDDVIAVASYISENEFVASRRIF
uniref:RRM domain-containing protein n=1 Tax=Ditylenchus dipsaci TaxID=166011 RepID=A0A915DPE6_9BILA